MKKVFEAFQVMDEDVKEYALHTLSEISIKEYDYVELYFDQIKEVTAQAVQSDSNRVGAQAFEFWTTLAEEEVERS